MFNSYSCIPQTVLLSRPVLTDMGMFKTFLPNLVGFWSVFLVQKSVFYDFMPYFIFYFSINPYYTKSGKPTA